MEAQRQLELVRSWSWLVLLFYLSAEASTICVLFFIDLNMVTIIAAVYVAEQRRSFWASQIGGL